MFVLKRKNPEDMNRKAEKAKEAKETNESRWSLLKSSKDGQNKKDGRSKNRLPQEIVISDPSAVKVVNDTIVIKTQIGDSLIEMACPAITDVNLGKILVDSSKCQIKTIGKIQIADEDANYAETDVHHIDEEENESGTRKRNMKNDQITLFIFDQPESGGLQLAKASDAAADTVEQSISEEYALQFVNFEFPDPPHYARFLRVPHVKNGFDNSCSEAAAESVFRYYGVDDWNQFRLHFEGYQTFDGGVSAGDRGLNALFSKGKFTRKGKSISLKTDYLEGQNIENIKEALDRRVPVIIRIFTDPAWQNPHTQVAIGYNEKGFFLNDNDQYESHNPHYIFRTFAQIKRQFSGRMIIIEEVK